MRPLNFLQHLPGRFFIAALVGLAALIGLAWNAAATLPPPPALREVAFTADGKTLMIGTGSGIGFWQVQRSEAGGGRKPVEVSRRCTRWLPLSLSSISFSPDGMMAAAIVLSYRKIPENQPVPANAEEVLTMSDDNGTKTIVEGAGRIRLLDLPSGKVRRTLPASDSEVSGSIFSPNGALLACSASGGRVRLLDVPSGKLRHTIQAAAKNSFLMSSKAFSPDGTILATGALEDGPRSRKSSWLPPLPSVIGKVRLWDVASGKLKRTFTVNKVWGAEESGSPSLFAIAFSPDGKLLAGGFHDSTLRIWEVRSGRWLRTLRHSNSVSALAFSPDGRTLASGTAQTLQLWDTRNWRLRRTLKGDMWPHSLVFSGAGVVLAGADGYHPVKLWRLR